MGSQPMRDGVHDFNADETNAVKEAKGGQPSGLTAGVASGLSSVETVANCGIQPEQETVGSVFRQAPREEDAGSKNGKNFKLKY